MSLCNKCKNNNLIAKVNITSCTTNDAGQHHSYEDQPARVYADGSKVWCKEGVCHRDNDKPAFMCYCSDCQGSYVFAQNGKIHRENGPAQFRLKFPYKERWYLDHVQMTEAEHAYEMIARNTKKAIEKRKEEKKKEDTKMTLQQRINDVLDNSNMTSWRQAVIDVIDVLCEVGQPFSSGEIARHLRLEAPTLQFSFHQIGIFIKELFAQKTTIVFFGSIEATRVLRKTSSGFDAYVYGPSEHICQTHEFEVEIPPATPVSLAPIQTTTPSTPLWNRPVPTSDTSVGSGSPMQAGNGGLTTIPRQSNPVRTPSKPLWGSGTSQPMIASLKNGKTRKSNRTTAVVHSRGALVIPTAALRQLDTSPGQTVSYRQRGTTLEIVRGFQSGSGWKRKTIANNKGAHGRLCFGRRDVGKLTHGKEFNISHDSFNNSLTVSL